MTHLELASKGRFLFGGKVSVHVDPEIIRIALHPIPPNTTILHDMIWDPNHVLNKEVPIFAGGWH